ncbi:MMPL family transporter [Salinispora pacifica]|uniref:MMPL family transporter n=1 Tax=Salinispora pacifica TaxID=351187 RepID=UPI00037C8720|nr:MMPL family transporter [Salinispora pacifica]
MTSSNDPVSTPRSRRSPLVERIVVWSVHHRALAIGGWFAVVLIGLLAGVLVTGDEARTTDPGEAGRAQQVIRAERADEVVRENVLIQGKNGQPFTDPAVRAAAEDVVTTLRGLTGQVTDIRSPLDAGATQLVSADGRSGLVSFQIATPVEDIPKNFDQSAAAIEQVGERHSDVRVLQAGDMSITAAANGAYDDDFRRAEIITLPVTIVILLIVFGALVAAGIPLLLSLTAVLATLGLLQAIGHWMPINSTVASMVLLIGMAVGIDYSLFYLRREREERHAGKSVQEALRVTARTSGHAVVVSGFTVMFCLAGLFLSGLDVFNGVAVGTILVVGLAVLGSVTVLPALLALLGHRVDRGRLPWLGRRRTDAGDSKVWSRVSGAAIRQPLLWGALATLLLFCLAAPAAHLKLRDPSLTDSLPRSLPAVDAVARIEEAFPGGPSPAQVVIWGEQVDSPAVEAAVRRLGSEVVARPDEFGTTLSTAKVGDALIVKVPLAGTGTDEVSNRSLAALREDLLPQTVGAVDGVEVAVAGDTAVAHDFAETLSARTPWIFGLVLVLAFLLLTVTFRSLTIPVVSILLNLMSIGAAYGVIVWGFQDGHLASLLGFTSYDGVVSWLPLFMFVILFGLSMDYHIFILSRIRERWLAGADPKTAITRGISSSAGVVTSAAVIMVAVFSIFVTLTAIEYKMLGVGMAVAVLIDVTVVRGVLLPAVLSLLGRSAWAFPGRGGDRRPQPAPEGRVPVADATGSVAAVNASAGQQ